MKVRHKCLTRLLSHKEERGLNDAAENKKGNKKKTKTLEQFNCNCITSKTFLF